MGRVELVRRFFSGRPDVVAWKTDHGYVPKKRPLSRDLIIGHLRGDWMLGAYPHLDGDLCPWCACDFDGKGNSKASAERKDLGPFIAREQAQALMEALEEADVPALANTSRSAKGYHVRVFFAEPIPCYLARAMMQGALDRADVSPSRDSVGFDRMFPTADRLLNHDGAIGSQIAIPLSGDAMPRGGAALLDDSWMPIPAGKGVWDRLQSQKRMKRVDVIKASLAFRSRNRLKVPTKRHKRPVGDPNAKKGEQRGLRTMMERCHFMREVAGHESLDYEQWVFLASQLIWFKGGRDVFHMISSADKHRYVHWRTDKKYSDIEESFHSPQTCQRLADSGWRCPELGDDGQCRANRLSDDRGAKAPAAVVRCRA